MKEMKANECISVVEKEEVGNRVVSSIHAGLLPSSFPLTTWMYYSTRKKRPNSR